MYYDIIQKESVDEYGNTKVELVPVTVAPEYPDISPKDMSLENQQKAGVKLQKVGLKSSNSLESVDKAEASIYENGSQIEFSDSVPSVEPSSEPGPEPKSEPGPEPKSE